MAEFRLSPAAQADVETMFDHGVAAWGLHRRMEPILHL